MSHFNINILVFFFTSYISDFSNIFFFASICSFQRYVRYVRLALMRAMLQFCLIIDFTNYLFNIRDSNRKTLSIVQHKLEILFHAYSSQITSQQNFQYLVTDGWNSVDSFSLFIDLCPSVAENDITPQ